jgi:hypothetical protein
LQLHPASNIKVLTNMNVRSRSILFSDPPIESTSWYAHSFVIILKLEVYEVTVSSNYKFGKLIKIRIVGCNYIGTGGVQR